MPLVTFGFTETHLDYSEVHDLLQREMNVNPTVDAASLAWEQGSSIYELCLGGHFHNASYREFRSCQNQRKFHSMGGAPAPGASMLYSSRVQREIISTVMNMTKILGRLKVKMPWDITVSIVGASGYFLLDSDSGELSPKAIGPDPLRLRAARITTANQFEDRVSIGRMLKDAFDYMSRTVGWERSHCYTSNGVFNIRGI